MWPTERNDQLRTSLFGRRRRVIAPIPLAILFVVTGLAIAAGIDGGPRPTIGSLPTPAAAVNATVAAPAVPAGMSGTNGAVGESGTAIAACSGCASPGPVLSTGRALHHLGNRTTANGIAIRIFTQSVSYPTSPLGSSVPEQIECSPTMLVPAEISDTQAVTVATGELSGTPTTATVIGSGAWGEPEGSPAAWVIVSAPSSVRLVVASFQNGRSDRMAPIDGIAVLATRLVADSASSSDVQPQGTVAAFDSNGTQVGSVAFGNGTTQIPSTCRWALPSSSTLPKSGPQPAHVGNARAAVRKAFNTVYSAAPGSLKSLYLQDFDEQVTKAGEAAAAANSEISAKSLPVVDKVVFTSKSQAAVLYQIDYDGNPVVGPKIGYAVLVGKTWKVTRATYCGDIDAAGTGVTC